MNGRHHNGQFANGNPGGPGRPRKSLEREYMTMAAEVVTPTRWRAVVERAARDAEAGDRFAREFLRKVFIGDRAVLEKWEDVPASEPLLDKPTSQLTLADMLMMAEKGHALPSEALTRLSHDEKMELHRRIIG